MKNKVLVGEMANLHNLSAQTLRYYDKIGLFQPLHIDKNNKYRYYDVEQFPMLDSILFLKKLGVPLEQIKEYFHDRDLDKMLRLLNDHEKILQEEIDVLNKHLINIRRKIDIVEQYRNNKYLYNCSLREIETRKIVFYNLKNGGNNINFEYGLKELYKRLKDDIYIFNSTICSIISKENVVRKNYRYLDAVGLVINNPSIKAKPIKVLEKGLYATLAFNGTDDEMEDNYKKLVSFIERNNYEIIGDGLVITITDITFSDYSEDYIKEIQVPVRSRSI